MKKKYISPILLQETPGESDITIPASQNGDHTGGNDGDPWEDDDGDFS